MGKKCIVVNGKKTVKCLCPLGEVVLGVQPFHFVALCGKSKMSTSIFSLGLHEGCGHYKNRGRTSFLPKRQHSAVKIAVPL